MKRFHGLNNLFHLHQGLLHYSDVAAYLLTDLQTCYCEIYGCIDEDAEICLAVLNLIPESLNYDRFDQRLDLIVKGPILRNDCPPLTYRLQGKKFAITGRCSMIPKVCGVDLYLLKSYTAIVNDQARQKFSIAIKPLLQMLKSD